eukprot:596119-Rhodomonas_salina.1
MPPLHRRRLLQALGGVFPCNHWLSSIRIKDSAACDLCWKREHYSHIVLTCPDTIAKPPGPCWK